jgi:hydroxyethylthiazole kinase-like uncharacterized protein yjeF
MTAERDTVRPDAGVYGRAHLPLHTAEQAAAADASAREQFGVPGRVLMESAGRAAALVLQRLWPEGRIVGVAGSGNNGGDLVVALRVLHAWGRDVAIVAADRAPDASLLHGADISILSGTAAEHAAARADIFVDGMLGTGARGAPRDAMARWIERIGDASRPVLALDIPSGVDATTGAVHEPAIHAAATIMFGWPKLGLLLHPARAHCGRLLAVEIGFPERCADSDARVITADFARAQLPQRAATAHKSSAGRLLVLAGQEGMAGAAAIATGAAIRAGAGLLRVASAAANRVVLQALVPEATFLDRTRVTRDDVDSMHALLAGPGLGTDGEARAALLMHLDLLRGRPTLLDADALNLLARDAGALRAVADVTPLVITPHVRELARLSGADEKQILDDPPAAARAAAREFNCVVLLKGQPSLVATPAGMLYVNSVGSSDVATAGMGDQLAGTVAALLAGGHDPLHAAALGLFVSARAADLAALGRSLTPGDVTAHLGRAMADPGPTASPLGLPFVTFDQPPRR